MPRLLLVDDDEDFLRMLSRALVRRGLEVIAAPGAEQARSMLSEAPCPDYAVVDLKLGQASGLNLVQELKTRCPTMSIVMLTGYASIATAVEAVKLGAVNYLAKPATVDDILTVLSQSAGAGASAMQEARPLSVDRLEWEHIQRVLAEHRGNISATARALNMHRRTLQRKLLKKPVRQ